MSETLKEKTAKGLFWGGVNNFLTQLLNLIIGIFLARWLSPSDYGMVGMLAIFSALAGSLQESGFIAGITNLKNPTAKDYNAVFWFSLLVGISLYIILYLASPLIALFFHQPELARLSHLVFLSFVLAGMGTAHSAYMFRNMMNKEKAIIAVAALIISGGVGLTLAHYGYAYWSIAWQQLLYIAVTDIGKVICVKWLPSLNFDFSPLRKMFNFSYKILLTNIVNNINNNILSFIFGRLFAPYSVGNFTQANKWSSMAYSLVSGTVAQVAQPIFSSVSDEQERQVRAFHKMMRFTAFIAFPVLFGLALVADEFIRITISDKWADSIPLLQILCLGGAFIPFTTISQNLIISRGRSDIYMYCTISQILFQIVVMIFTYPFGITVMVAAFSLINILWFGVWQHFVCRISDIRLLTILKDIIPFLAISLSVMAVTWFVTQPIEDLLFLLFVRIFIAASLYFLVMKMAHAVILEECLAYLFKR